MAEYIAREISMNLYFKDAYKVQHHKIWILYIIWKKAMQRIKCWCKLRSIYPLIINLKISRIIYNSLVQIKRMHSKPMQILLKIRNRINKLTRSYQAMQRMDSKNRWKIRKSKQRLGKISKKLNQTSKPKSKRKKKSCKELKKPRCLVKYPNQFLTNC